MKKNIETILKEINSVLINVDEAQVDELVSDIIKANKIIVCGAGRVGMAIRGFGMRLSHLGLNAGTLGDSNVPSIGVGDLLIIASGSGETQTIYDLALIAKKNKSRIQLITGNLESRIGKVADACVLIKAPSKTKPVENFISIQPMTTLNEQCLGIFFDAVVLELMNKLNETHETMWKRHSNLE